VRGDDYHFIAAAYDYAAAILHDITATPPLPFSLMLFAA